MNFALQPFDGEVPYGHLHEFVWSRGFFSSKMPKKLTAKINTLMTNNKHAAWSLSLQSLPEHGFNHFVGFLKKHHRKIQHVALTFVHVKTHQDAKKLCLLLEALPCLSHLECEQSLLLKQGTIALAHMVEGLEKLHTLRLSNTHLSFDYAFCLAKSLAASRVRSLGLCLPVLISSFVRRTFVMQQGLPLPYRSFSWTCHDSKEWEQVAERLHSAPHLKKVHVWDMEAFQDPQAQEKAHLHLLLRCLEHPQVGALHITADHGGVATVPEQILALMDAHPSMKVSMSGPLHAFFEAYSQRNHAFLCGNVKDIQKAILAYEEQAQAAGLAVSSRDTNTLNLRCVVAMVAKMAPDRQAFLPLMEAVTRASSLPPPIMMACSQAWETHQRTSQDKDWDEEEGRPKRLPLMPTHPLKKHKPL